MQLHCMLVKGKREMSLPAAEPSSAWNPQTRGCRLLCRLSLLLFMKVAAALLLECMGTIKGCIGRKKKQSHERNNEKKAQYWCACYCQLLRSTGCSKVSCCKGVEESSMGSTLSQHFFENNSSWYNNNPCEKAEPKKLLCIWSWHGFSF